MKGTIGNFSVMEKVMKGAEKDYQGRQVEKEQRLMVGAVMLVGRGSYAQKTSFRPIARPPKFRVANIWASRRT